MPMRFNSLAVGLVADVLYCSGFKPLDPLEVHPETAVVVPPVGLNDYVIELPDLAELVPEVGGRDPRGNLWLRRLSGTYIRKYVLSMSVVEEVILVTTTLITLGTCCLNTMVFVRQPRALYVGRS